MTANQHTTNPNRMLYEINAPDSGNGATAKIDPADSLAERGSADDARRAIEWRLIQYPPPNLDGGVWNSPARESFSVNCPVCAGFHRCELIPQLDGKIKSTCTSAAGCTTRQLQAAFKEQAQLILTPRRPRKSKAPAPVLQQPDSDGFFNRIEPNELGDAWRLAERYGARLLAVKSDYSDGGMDNLCFTLDPETGIWNRHGDALAELHNETRDWTQVAVEQLAYDGRLPRQLADELRRYLRRNVSTAKIAEIAKQMHVALRQMRTREIPNGVSRAEINQVDSDLRYLGTQNGIVDLATAKLVDADIGAGCLVTRRTAAAYNPDAQHPLVDKLLGHLAELERGYILSAVGYHLRFGVRKRGYLLVGARDSGKSTLLSAIEHTLGPVRENGYAMSIKADALLKDSYANPQGHQANLIGLHECRFAAVSEFPEAKTGFSVSLLKTICDGIANLPLRDAHAKKGVDKPAQGTLFIALNPVDESRLDLTDNALASRLRLLPWPALNEIDSDFMAQFKATPAAADALLALLVHHAAKFGESDPPPPDTPEVAERTMQHRNDSIGPLGQWFDRRIVITRQRFDRVLTDGILDAAAADLGVSESGLIAGHDRKSALALLREVKQDSGMPNARKMSINGIVGQGYQGVILVAADSDSGGAAAEAGLCYGGVDDSAELPRCTECGKYGCHAAGLVNRIFRTPPNHPKMAEMADYIAKLERQAVNAETYPLAGGVCQDCGGVTKPGAGRCADCANRIVASLGVAPDSESPPPATATLPGIMQGGMDGKH